MTDPIVAFVILILAPDCQLIRDPRAAIPMSECARDQIGFQAERANALAQGKLFAIGRHEILGVLCEPCPCAGLEQEAGS